MRIDVNEVLSMIIQMIIVPAIIYGLTLLRSWILAKTKAVKVQTVVLMADEAIRGAVATVSQTFVDALKIKGEWTPDRYAEAAKRAYDMAIMAMSSDTISILTEITGSTEEWIQQKIEEVVRQDRLRAKETDNLVVKEVIQN